MAQVYFNYTQRRHFPKGGKETSEKKFPSDVPPSTGGLDRLLEASDVLPVWSLEVLLLLIANNSLLESWFCFEAAVWWIRSLKKE